MNIFRIYQFIISQIIIKLYWFNNDRNSIAFNIELNPSFANTGVIGGSYCIAYPLVRTVFISFTIFNGASNGGIPDYQSWVCSVPSEYAISVGHSIGICCLQDQSGVIHTDSLQINGGYSGQVRKGYTLWNQSANNKCTGMTGYGYWKY